MKNLTKYIINPNTHEIFLNLTAGLEYEYFLSLKNCQFERWQSTYLEQKLHEKFLKEISNNFLMKLAIGRKCLILDCTSRKKKNNTSRALWQGIPWIEYCLNRIWFNKEITCSYGMHKTFQEKFISLSKCTRNRFKYYRKFLLTSSINICYISKGTDHDSDEEFYKNLIKRRRV